MIASNADGNTANIVNFVVFFCENPEYLSAHDNLGKLILFSGVCTIVHKLVEGDRVWAEPRDTREYNNNGYSSLSGHLVHINKLILFTHWTSCTPKLTNSPYLTAHFTCKLID